MPLSEERIKEIEACMSPQGREANMVIWDGIRATLKRFPDGDEARIAFEELLDDLDADRAELLAEVDRLRAENTRLSALADELAGALRAFVAAYDDGEEFYEASLREHVRECKTALSSHAKMKGEG